MVGLKGLPLCVPTYLYTDLNYSNMRGIATLLMRSPLYASGLTGLFGGLSLFFPPLYFFSGAGVGLITLHLGVQKALLVTAGAMLVSGLISLVVVHTPAPALALAIALWLPALVCCWILRITESQAMALLAVGALSALYAIGMYLVIGDVGEWWRVWIEKALNAQQFPEEMRKQILEGANFDLMNGQIALTTSSVLFLSVLLARWWQSILYNPGGFRSEFHALQLPRTLAVLVTALIALVLTKTLPGLGTVWGDLLIIAILMYFMQGLAVMHGIIGSRDKPVWWLFPIYAGLFILPPHVVLGLVLVGLVDALVNFRGRNVDKASKD